MENRKEGTTFESLIEEIKPVYRAEKQKLLDEILSFRQEYSFLKSKSVLQFIGESHLERHHSKLLEYIWKSNQRIFLDFILSIPQLSNNEQLREWILEGNYSIGSEIKTTDGKFIDLLITDNKKRFCIVIENKINSAVSRYGNDKLQLDSYYKHVNKKMPKNTEKYFLLLSHRDNKKYTVKNKWIYTSYYPVFHSITTNISNYSVEDDYLKQYAEALFSILFNSEEMWDNIDEQTPISVMSLFYQNIITKIK